LWTYLQGADDNSSSRKSNATSLKMLLEKEMSKEAESKRRPPSVIARLMGLEEDLPTKEPIVHHTVSDSSTDLNATNNTLQGKERHQFTMLKTQNDQSCHEKIEYNDVYEVSEGQSGTGYFHDRTSQKGRCLENKSKQFDIAQDKIMEPEHFAIEEKLLCTKELPEALVFPCSNRDLFLEFPEEHNPTFSRQSSGLHANRAPPQTKRITVLKPIRSVDINGIRRSKAEIGKQNVLKMRRFHQIPSSKEEIPSQPSRIVLLRPTPGKPGISKAKLTSRATSFQLTNRNSLSGSLDDNQASIGSAGLAHGIMQRQQDGCQQRDDSLLSSAYSNGYGGDESSFSDSEVDYTSGSEINYIEDGDTLSDSEGGSPLSKHSWNYIRRYEGQCSSSSFSKISHFSESSVITEAKKQLSERWSMVTCNETSQVQLSRRNCTLGEMLSIKEAKKDEATTGMFSVSSNQSCGLENELTTHSTNVTSMKLPRSKSVPVISSTSDNMVVNVQASNPESCKLKVAVVSNKGKSAFKGRVSDFFLSKSKKPRRQMSTYHPSDYFAERLEGCIIHSHEMDAIEKAMHCEDRFDSFPTRISTSTSDVSISRIS
jgi:hypothetical protein